MDEIDCIQVEIIDHQQRIQELRKLLKIKLDELGEKKHINDIKTATTTTTNVPYTMKS